MEMLNIDSHDHRSLAVDPQRRVLYVYVGRLTQHQALARLGEKERKEGRLTFERHSCSRGTARDAVWCLFSTRRRGLGGVNFWFVAADYGFYSGDGGPSDRQNDRTDSRSVMEAWETGRMISGATMKRLD